MNPGHALSEKNIGHIRHLKALSLKLPGDWSGMGSDWWDIGERSLQYQLSFGAYALGLAQYHYTPAYRELIQPTMKALIEKMMVPDVWENWANASRGGKIVDPDQEELGVGWLDPVKKYNLMLKGHLLQMGALYETLYGKGSFNKPDSFSFAFRATTWGNGPETFNYSLNDIARILYDEYVQSNYEGCQCEPNRVYPMCNQHAILGLIHHDHVYGTEYSKDVMPKFKAAWLRKGYTDMETKSHMRLLYVRQNKIQPADTPWSDGWTGVFMHAWDRDFIQSLYPDERDHHLDFLLSGRDAARVQNAMVPTSAKIGFGMFATLAAEVGDLDARDRLLNFADKNFAPMWSNGAFFYPRNDKYSPDEQGNFEGVDALTANALLPMARLNVGQGLWALYNHAPEAASLAYPYISNVDQSSTDVSQAYYDPKTKALHVTLLPGAKKGGRVCFNVQKLNSEKPYKILKDGEATADFQWISNSAVSINSELPGARSFIIAEA